MRTKSSYPRDTRAGTSSPAGSRSTTWSAAGSGSERIRGIFEYLARTKGHWQNRKLEDVLVDGMQMLDIAADLDSATGGFSKRLPIAKVLDRSGAYEHHRPVHVRVAVPGRFTEPVDEKSVHQQPGQRHRARNREHIAGRAPPPWPQ